ncbi:hypothetical protein FXF06_06950 [Vibrio cholerae]|nr:hypothetical protein FXF06_06950 [Vibrio cholerae]
MNSFTGRYLKRDFICSSITSNLKEYNAHLRGWQRITTKLKYNNCNHRGSMGLETPRVDSPS